MKKNIIIYMFIVSYFIFLTGCKKSSSSEDEQPATMELSFSVDNSILEFNTIKYLNAAGNNFSVSKLHCYLSNFQIENSDGTIYHFDDIIYVEASSAKSLSNFSSLPLGNYRRISFLIGLDSAHNTEHALPHTVENDNMAWPASMGGGYHFIKLEGNFINASQTFGYAMHLGLNRNCVAINISKQFTITSESNTIQLNMNINEWFKNPMIYDFNIDGNYSMSDSTAMAKLSQNGADVFTIN